MKHRAVWLLVALVAAFFHQPLTTATFYFRDLYRLFYPKRLFFAAALRAGELPLWDPMTSGGVPYLANPQNFTFHPTNLLYLVLPSLLAFNLVLVLHVLFCALAAWWLARDSGLSQPAAFVAGVAFAFCGYTLSLANLMPFLLALPWIPTTIVLTQRALRESRSLLPAALSAAMPLYCGAADLAAMTFVVVALWFVFEKRARAALLFVVLGGIGLSLAQTLPTTSAVAQSTRAAGVTYEAFTQWSVAPQRLPELVIPRWFGDTDSLDESRYRGAKYESQGYPYIISIYHGAPLLLLAASGARRRPALAILAAVALLLSLGQHLPFFRALYDHVPFVTLFRYPVKAQMAALLPLAILAATGVAHMRRLPLSVMAALAAIALAFFSVHAAIAAAAFALAVFLRREWLIAGVVAADLLIAGWNVNDFAPRDLFAEPPLVAAARQAAGEGRLYAARKPNFRIQPPDDDLMWLARAQIETLDNYNSAIFGIPAVYNVDYDSLAPARMGRLTRAVERLPWPARKTLLARADARAVLAPAALSLPGFREMASLPLPGEPLRLYAHAGAVPARFVSSALRAGDEREAARMLLAQPDLGPVILEEPPAAIGNCGSATVRVVHRRLNEARYDVDAPCAGYVVFAENHYDGWTATIDGRQARHVRADFAFTALAVTKGRHVIERRYFPPRLLAGLAGAVATAIVLFVVDRRRLRRRLAS